MRPRIRKVYLIPAAVAAAVIILMSLQGDSRQSGARRQSLRNRLKTFRAVPYTFVTEEEVDPTRSGVVTHKEKKTYGGYNLYCGRLSSETILMDMAGRVVHRWSYPDSQARTWNHAVLLEGGDLLVIRKLHDLIKLDWESNLIWRSEIQPHHDLAVLPDGTIEVIVQEQYLHKGVSVRFPAIARLTGDGDEIERWSAYENLDEIRRKFDQRSFLDAILDSLIAAEGLEGTSRAKAMKARIDTWPQRYDQFHMNTIGILPDTPLGERDPRFAPGNLLICFRNVNQIAVLEKDSKEILWVWGEGHLEWPHHPTMVGGGNLLVFDNGTRRGYSRVLEIDPVSGETQWEYVADPVEDFYTPEKGSSQRLPNGNTLICEGDRGRGFEVTREGEIVWEWYNPALHEKRREQIYRITRIDSSVVERILALKGGS